MVIDEIAEWEVIHRLSRGPFHAKNGRTEPISLDARSKFS
jgi:hypothetical protein